VPEQDTERLTLSIDAAARALGIGRSLAYELARQGRIPTCRLGRRLVVPKAALEKMLGMAGSRNDKDANGSHTDGS